MTRAAGGLILHAGRVRLVREIDLRIQTARYRPAGCRASGAVTIVGAPRRCTDLGVTPHELDGDPWRNLADNAGPVCADELQRTVDGRKIRVRKTRWSWKLSSRCADRSSR